MSSLPIPFGHYDLLEEVGSGASAVVYRAQDKTLLREVAVKIFNPAFLQDSSFVESVYREARIIARLDHPNIITLYEVDQAEARLYLSMEYAAHSSLEQHIRRNSRGLEWHRALTILEGICSALQYAHTNNIVHCDLKPSNILMRTETTPIVGDFGLARIVNQAQTSQRISSGFVGTPAYTAPELWDGCPPTIASDIYALGCIVYEMLTGRALFEGPTPLQIMRLHDKGPVFEADQASRITAEVRAVLAMALNKDPGGRICSCAAFLSCLKGPSVAPTLKAGAATKPGAGITTPEPDAYAGLYQELRAALEPKQLRQADKVTKRIMLLSGDQVEEGRFPDEKIYQVKCKDLRSLDNMWRFYADEGLFRRILEGVGRYGLGFVDREHFAEKLRQCGIPTT